MVVSLLENIVLVILLYTDLVYKPPCNYTVGTKQYIFDVLTPASPRFVFALYSISMSCTKQRLGSFLYLLGDLKKKDLHHSFY